MKWTTELPKEPGFYWKKDTRFRFAKPEIVEVVFDSKRPDLQLFYFFTGMVEHFSPMPTDLWAGPISEPEEE